MVWLTIYRFWLRLAGHEDILFLNPAEERAVTQRELCDQLSAAGLFPIPVHAGVEREDIRGVLYAGDTAGFVAAAQALANRCVFVASRTLVDADFEYVDADGLSVDGKSSVINLITTQPKLGEFKTHLGAHCGHRLWVGADRPALEHLVLSPWWDSFATSRENAIAAVVRDRDAAWARQEEEEESQREALLHQLRGLITDPQFLKLPTQMAMHAYAVELVPDLEGLGEKALKAEIQALDAKIKARGLRGKK
jgi:hypothetical protein